jgi:hypothetical protein
MAAAKGNRGGGRPHKGDRKFVGFRLPCRTADEMEAVAEAEGFKYVSDWVAHVVQQRLANTDLTEICRQEELPIGQIAS